MKKLLLILLILLFPLTLHAEEWTENIDLSNEWVEARMNVGIMGSGGITETTGCSLLGSNGTTTGSTSSGYAFGIQITATSTCKINRLYMYDKGSCNGTHVMLGLYASDGTYPTGTPIVTSSAITQTAVASWKSGTITDTTLTNGSKYHIVAIQDASMCYSYVASDDAGKYMTWAVDNYPTFPTWSGTSKTSFLYAIYAIYE